MAYSIVIERSNTYDKAWNAHKKYIEHQLYNNVIDAYDALESYVSITGAILIDSATVYVPNSKTGQNSLIRVVFTE